jgi:pimeloyl-ACP methyl ester carboxylesterase
MTASPATPPETTDHWIPHPGGRLFARSWTPAHAAAAAAPIVMFHDSLGSVALWRDFPAQLATATGRRVVAYDRLGFGESDQRTDRPAIDFVAEEAATSFPALRAALGLRRFVALGHSVGGGMAIHCAAAAGADCEALVTIAAQVFAEERTLEGIRAAREQFRDPAQVQRLARYHGPRAQWVLDAWIGTWLHADFADWNVRDVLPRVTCPVLALHGDSDEYGSTVHPRLIGERAGGAAQVEILPDTGHVPHRERTEVVLGLIARFLQAGASG